MVDLEGRVLGLNARGAHLLGVAAREMVGASASQLVEGTRDGIDWSDGGARILADLSGAGHRAPATSRCGSAPAPGRSAARRSPRDLLGNAVA